MIIDFVVVTCEGCNDLYVGGDGSKSDPLMDVSYDPENQTFICGACYAFGTDEPISIQKMKRINTN